MASELVNFVTVKYRTAILYQLLSILCNHSLFSPTHPDFNWLVYLNIIWPILIKCNVNIHVDINRPDVKRCHGILGWVVINCPL